LNSASGYENRHPDPVLSARTDKRFELPGQSSQALRMHLAISSGNVRAVGFDAIKAKDARFTHLFKQDEFPLLMRVANTDQVQVSKYILAHSITSVSVNLPEFSGSSHMRVRFSGQFKANKDGTPAGIAITTAEKGGQPWLLPNVPFSLPVSKEWSRFEVEDLVPVNIYGSPITTLALGLYPGPWPEASGVGPSVARGVINFRNLKLEVEPYSSIDLAGCDLRIY